jgi:hypothetical protein
MSDQAYQPIETQFGIFRGRDTLFVDTIALHVYPNELALSGKINGTNASRNPTLKDIVYIIAFHHIKALKMITLDLWDWKSASCFDEVINSQWMAQLNSHVITDCKHYLLQTYDQVFDIVCRSYSIELTQFQP